MQNQKNKQLNEYPLRIIQQIPNGSYCYDSSGICPFWSKRKDKPNQKNGYCFLLKLGDWMEDERNAFNNIKTGEIMYMGLLWDQVKACGINDFIKSCEFNGANSGLVKLDKIVNLPVKTLTISQPFASLIASGDKFVENRNWKTNYRGPLAIHAGKGTQYLTKKYLKEYPTSKIIAITILTACVALDDVQKGKKEACESLTSLGINVEDFLNHKYTEGPWCWILKYTTPCFPEPCSGKQGLWDFHGRK